jgi:inhibitor of cysteine peptidase
MVIEIDCERFSATAGDQVRLVRQVTVAKGAVIVVSLCSNPSTGFSWGNAIISSPEVLTEQAREFVPPTVAMPGAPGMEQWGFLAVEQGACTVSLSYSRPWDGGEGGAREFELKVEVT